MNKNFGLKTSSKVLCVIFVCAGIVLVILSAFVACVEGFAFNRHYYVTEYAKLNSAAYVGVDYDTLKDATDILLDYIEGKRDNLDYQYSDGTQLKEYYTAREKAHMVDVAALNANAVNFAKIGFPVGAVLLILSFFTAKQPYLTCKSVFITTIIVTVFFAALGVWAAADFDVFWINFHKVFFTNDLWLLDPRTSLMIRMFSAQFFFDMVAGILAVFIAVIAAVLIASGLLTRKYGKKYFK